MWLLPFTVSNSRLLFSHGTEIGFSQLHFHFDFDSKIDLRSVKTNQHAKYLRQRSRRSKIIDRKQTHTLTGSTALSEPLKRSWNVFRSDSWNNQILWKLQKNRITSSHLTLCMPSQYVLCYVVKRTMQRLTRSNKRYLKRIAFTDTNGRRIRLRQWSYCLSIRT